MMAVLDHLQQASARPDMNSESLQEAIFAISNAYTLNMHSAATKQRYPLDGLSLSDVYKAGRTALLNSKAGTSSNGTDATNGTTTTRSSPATATASPIEMDVDNKEEKDEEVIVEDDAGFNRFVERLKSTTAFFKGVEDESSDYSLRLNHARRKYNERLAAKKKQRLEDTQQQSSTTSPPTQSASRATTTTAPGSEQQQQQPAVVVSEEDKAKAKEIKERGNAQLKAKQYEAALQSYNECISLDGTNAVYYSNRAAANIKLSRFTEAVDDCKKAIAIDPAFARPRERLASAYRHLGMTRQELQCLREAVNMHPDNVGLGQALRDAEARSQMEQQQSAGGAGAGGGGGQFDAGMIDMMSRSMGLNMPEGLAQTLANSDMVNQVGSMVRDNPAMVEQLMRMMGGNNNNNRNNNNNNS